MAAWPSGSKQQRAIGSGKITSSNLSRKGSKGLVRELAKESQQQRQQLHSRIALAPRVPALGLDGERLAGTVRVRCIIIGAERPGGVLASMRFTTPLNYSVSTLDLFAAAAKKKASKPC